MQAYESIGLQYFYLGIMNKAVYYSERMMKGKFEAKFSTTRKTYLRIHNQMMNQEESTKDGGDDGEEGGAKKHIRSQNRKNWIKNAIVGLMD
jgi:hypothetical protein